MLSFILDHIGSKVIDPITDSNFTIKIKILEIFTMSNQWKAIPLGKIFKREQIWMALNLLSNKDFS